MWLFLTHSLLEPTRLDRLKVVAPEHNTGTHCDPADVQKVSKRKAAQTWQCHGKHCFSLYVPQVHSFGKTKWLLAQWLKLLKDMTRQHA